MRNGTEQRGNPRTLHIPSKDIPIEMPCEEEAHFRILKSPALGMVRVTHRHSRSYRKALDLGFMLGGLKVSTQLATYRVEVNLKNMILAIAMC